MFASILFGGFSYYLIEQTLRFKRWNLVFALTSFIIIPFSFAQINYYFSKKNSIKYQKIFPKETFDAYTCRQDGDLLLDAENFLFRKNCKYNSKLEPNVILWGDSNAYHYIPALTKIGENMGFGFRNVTHEACHPFVVYNKEEYLVSSDRSKYSCNKASSIAYKLVKNYDIVILSSYWFMINNYKSGSDKILYKELDNTLLELSKTAKLILVLGGIPLMDSIDIKNIIQHSFINKNKNYVNGVNNTIVFKLNKNLKDVLSKHPKAYYLDFNNLLCNKNTCQYKDNENSLYYKDGIHLSLYGSEFLGKKYLEIRDTDDVFSKIKKLYKENPEDTFIKNKDLILKQRI